MFTLRLAKMLTSRFSTNRAFAVFISMDTGEEPPENRS